MKKIMIAAAAVALVGATFAAGNTFEYKASVKYVDMNKKTVKIDGDRVAAYIKVVKTASLTGYLIVDPTCPCTTPEGDAAPKLGFLVVENKAKKTGPKLFPANLYAKWWRDQVGAKALQAEGYLFAGLGQIAAVASPEAAQNFGDNATKETSKLFGAYNMKEAGEQGAFYESWLDAAGFGKASFAEGEEEGCDIGEDGICLKNLSGSVIGGLFLCRPNSLGEDFLCMKWAGTTDVISGTWSIKNTDKLNGSKHEAFTAAEQAAQIQANNASAETLYWVSTAGAKMKSGWSLANVEQAFRNKWF